SLLGANVTLIVSGVGLLVAVLSFPGGIAEVAFDLRDKLVARWTGRSAVTRAVGEAAVAVRPRLPPRVTPDQEPVVDGPVLEARAGLGLGRTFQQARLFDDLTLADALKVALERSEPSELVPSVLGLPPARAAERRKTARAEELLELLGLSEHGSLHVAELST